MRGTNTPLKVVLLFEIGDLVEITLNFHSAHYYNWIVDCAC